MKLAEIADNIGFSKLVLVRIRTFERKVIETCLYAEMKGLGILMCSARVTTESWPNLPKIPPKHWLFKA